MMPSRNSLCPCGSGLKYKKCCATRKRRLLVCTPMRDRARPEYLQALARDSERFEIVHLTEVGRPVTEARNILARRAREIAIEGDYVLWADDDCWWSAANLNRMIETLDRQPEIDILSAMFGGRDHFAPPFCWRKWDDDASIVDPGRNCAIGAVVPIESCGFHCLMMRSAVLHAVGDNPFDPVEGLRGEDVTFCVRALHSGLRLAVATGEKVAHIGDNGDAYFVGAPRAKIVAGEIVMPKRFAMPCGPRKLEAPRAYEEHVKAASQPKRMPRPVRDTRAAAEWIAQRQHDGNCSRLADKGS